MSFSRGIFLKPVPLNCRLELLRQRSKIDGGPFHLAGARDGLLAGLPNVAHRLHHLRKADLLLIGAGAVVASGAL